MLPLRTFLNRRLWGCLLVLLLVGMAGCLPGSSPSPIVSSVPATRNGRPQPTAENTESPTTIYVPTATPEPTSTPPPLPSPKFIAVMLCKSLPPPDDSAHGEAECNIEVYQPPQTEPVFYLLQEGISFERPSFSPDGRWLAYVENHKEPATGEEQSRIRVVSTDWQTDRPVTDWFRAYRDVVWLWCLSWSVDSQWLAFQHYNKASWAETMYIANIDTGELRLVGDSVGCLAWSSKDPSLLAFTSGQLPFWMGRPDFKVELYLASIDDLEHPQRVAFPGGNQPISLAWQPDDTLLAFCTCEDRHCASGDIWLVDTDSLSVEQVDQHSQRCEQLLWSPDGVWLASYAGILGYKDVIFYKAGDWNVTRQVTSGHIRSGIWTETNFFLGDEELIDNTGRNIRYQLVAISLDGPEKYVLWNPEDLGLLEKIEGRALFLGLDWYVPVRH